MFHLAILCISFFISVGLFAQEYKKSKVDYDAFVTLTKETNEYRKDHLISVDTFKLFMQDEKTILLDTRSESAFKRKHIKGAVHLNFSDFTEEKLAKVILDTNTRILIYCNNNIQGDKINYAAKAMPLALNIPTYINLYGYGYKNVYELRSLIDIDSGVLEFEGEGVK